LKYHIILQASGRKLVPDEKWIINDVVA